MRQNETLSRDPLAPPKVWWLVVICTAVVLLWAINWLLLKDIGSQDRGTFGDMFGGLNALFSGLAFAVLIFTLMQQRAELTLQRRELELTREELAGQKEQLKDQNETLALQRFENTFFQLLRLHADIVRGIDLVSMQNHQTTTGRDCFVVFANRLHSYLAQKRVNNKPLSLDDIQDAYLSFYQREEINIAHYFRSLYNIVKFVDTSAVSNERKQFYVNLVRAQLSSQELYLLYFNGLSSLGSAKMKPLIERYCFLKHVNRGDLNAVGAFLPLYAPGALD